MTVRIQPVDTHSDVAGGESLHPALPQCEQRIGLPLPGTPLRLLGPGLCGGVLPADPAGPHRLDTAAAGAAAQHDVRLGHTDDNHLYGDSDAGIHAAGRHSGRGVDRCDTRHHPDIRSDSLRGDTDVHDAGRSGPTVRHRGGAREIQPGELLAVADRTDVLGSADLRPVREHAELRHRPELRTTLHDDQIDGRSGEVDAVRRTALHTGVAGIRLHRDGAIQLLHGAAGTAAGGLALGPGIPVVHRTRRSSSERWASW